MNNFTKHLDDFIRNVFSFYLQVPCKDTENSGIFDVDLTKGTFDPDTIVVCIFLFYYIAYARHSFKVYIQFFGFFSLIFQIPDNCTTTKFNREESSECENGKFYAILSM